MNLKDTIIRVAYDLFATKGYEKTTIGDIVKSSGSSKGGFYHHFKSKEDILDAILESYVQDLKAYYHNLYEKYDHDTVMIFNGVFEAINSYKTKQMVKWPELMKILGFPGNDLIIMRMTQSFEKMTHQFYTEVIQMGVDKKVWTASSATMVAGLWTREILSIYTEISKLLFGWSEEAYETFVSFLEFNQSLINSLLKTNKILIKDNILAYALSAKETTNKMNSGQ